MDKCDSSCDSAGGRNTEPCELCGDSPSRKLPQKETQGKEGFRGETCEVELNTAEGKGHPGQSPQAAQTSSAGGGCSGGPGGRPRQVR